MANLLIKDETHQGAARQYLSSAQSIEALVTEYTAILRAIVAEKNLEGQAAAALSEFADLAQGYLQSELDAIFQNHHTKTNIFVETAVADDEAEIS